MESKTNAFQRAMLELVFRDGFAGIRQRTTASCSVLHTHPLGGADAIRGSRADMEPKTQSSPKQQIRMEEAACTWSRKLSPRKSPLEAADGNRGSRANLELKGHLSNMELR
jgi:hypothetical protein